MKRFLVIVLILVSAELVFADKSFTMNVWPDKAPGKVTDQQEMKKPDKGDNIIRLTNVSVPTITIYKAKDSTRQASAVIVCPGGGYGILAFNHEGTEIAEWLNSIGYTAVLLKYRVPGNRDGAFQDAQRAIRLVRHNAAKWNVDSRRIGVLGFSAGGHLSARVSTGYNEKIYENVDEADELSCRPDFTVLIYPAYLSQKRDNYDLAPEIKITSKTPPAFLLETSDDVYVNSSIVYYKALKDAGVKAELHLFQKGGHGYGLRPSANPVSGWPKLCEKWLKQMK